VKITTWNVNGLRAILNKGFEAWVEQEAPDILCLQEIKARPEQIRSAPPFLPAYQAVWNPAERPGYSGVASFWRQPTSEIRLGLGDPRFDVEGRVIQARIDDFLLFNIYFPSGQRSQERVAYKLDFYARLLEICDDLQARGEKIILTGDFNTAHREIDLANPRENSKNSGFLPEERVWIDHYLEHGFVDTFRRLYPEKVQYTWWTYRFGVRERNIGWRIDYFLVSEALFPRVDEVVIHDAVHGSDHCPLSLIIH
jgi:exodeoxyribonuclease-3